MKAQETLRDHLAAAGVHHAAIYEGDLQRAESLVANGHDHVSALARAAILNGLDEGDLTLAELETIFGEGVLNHVYTRPASSGSEDAEDESIETEKPVAEEGDAEESANVSSAGEDVAGEADRPDEDQVPAAAGVNERLVALIDHIAKELQDIVRKPEPEPDNGDGSRSAPVVVVSADDIERATGRIDSEASEAQLAAGNYRKGHLRFDNFDITIETPKGGIRRGKRDDGSEWEVEMPSAYGYLKRSAGADDEPVDVFLVDDAKPGTVFAIDQIDPKTGRFDEHKLILGVGSEKEARDVYSRAFSDRSGPKRIGALTRMTSDELRDWLQSDGGKRPIGSGVAYS